MRKTILVVFPLTPAQQDRIREAAKGHDVYFVDKDAIAPELLERAQIVFGVPDKEVITAMPRLEWLQLYSAGVGPFTQPGLLLPTTALTNSTGAFGLAISEHMLGMLLCLMKNLHLYRDNQHVGLWRDEGQITSIARATTLVVGLGDIGGAFATRMHALGSHTIGVRRVNLEKPDYLDELYLLDKLDELLPRADIVALSLPHTPQTDNLFDRARLGRMKKGAFLLNVGRGTVLDTDALCDGLDSGAIGGAGLDVTKPEPLPKDHRLWRCQNALITPHVSGWDHLPETQDLIVDIFTSNMARFFAGEELHNLVDFESGYRAHKK